ncbi:hypothetical protein HN832_04560 [archaeon]|jgi:hypothetical protein|nr:hypothetical protein [archaeon]MBT4373335.1 hypothetical protein [archaeon]MBT4531783.1 hypothetical protein [archaeon]MBT7001450.1 hypothetical protein [archaeon]MBT7282658.1 hypothetical protein [archaeon]
MAGQTIDTGINADEATAVKSVLQQIVRVQEVEMSKHSEGSCQYNLARLEWSKANAGLTRADGDMDMHDAYQREVRHYSRLVETQESSR